MKKIDLLRLLNVKRWKQVGIDLKVLSHVIGDVVEALPSHQIMACHHQVQQGKVKKPITKFGHSGCLIGQPISTLDGVVEQLRAYCCYTKPSRMPADLVVWGDDIYWTFKSVEERKNRVRHGQRYDAVEARTSLVYFGWLEVWAWSTQQGDCWENLQVVCLVWS